MNRLPIIFFGAWLLVSGVASAQSPLTLLPADTNIYLDNVDLSDEFLWLFNTIHLKNETQDTLQILWEREIPAGCPAAWETQISDIFNDYPPFVGSNFIPPVFTPFSLYPGQDDAYFQVNLLPHGTAGCCEVAIHFYEASDPGAIIATAHFNFRINDPDCSITGVNERRETAIQVFPNPVNDTFTWEPAWMVTSVDLYNLYGRQVSRCRVAPCDLSGLPAGSYLVRIRTSDHQEQWSRILKR